MGEYRKMNLIIICTNYKVVGSMKVELSKREDC